MRASAANKNKIRIFLFAFVAEKNLPNIFTVFYFRMAAHPRNAYTHICNLNSMNIRVRELENGGGGKRANERGKTKKQRK